MQDIGYESVARVLESWDSARRTGKDSSFEKEFGKLLIDRYVCGVSFSFDIVALRLNAHHLMSLIASFFPYSNAP